MTNQECAIQRHRGKQTCTQRGKDLLTLEKLIFCKSQTLRNDLKSKLYLILILPVQSVPITINVVSSNPAQDEVYSIKHYVTKFVSDFPKFDGLQNALQQKCTAIMNIFNIIDIKYKSNIFDYRLCRDRIFFDKIFVSE